MSSGLVNQDTSAEHRKAVSFVLLCFLRAEGGVASWKVRDNSGEPDGADDADSSWYLKQSSVPSHFNVNLRWYLRFTAASDAWKTS